jgi:heat shock protein HslJ
MIFFTSVMAHSSRRNPACPRLPAESATRTPGTDPAQDTCKRVTIKAERSRLEDNTLRNHLIRGLAAAIGMQLALIASAGNPAAQLAGSEWRPTHIGNIETPQETALFVRFGAKGQLSGHGGCNRFFGAYATGKAGIEIGPLGATRMACPEPIMDLEQRFLTALQSAKDCKRNGTRLTCSDARGETTLRFVQTDWD